MRLAALGLLLACSSHAPEHAITRGSDARIVTATDVATDAIADATACPAGVKLENGACTKDADCVLTDVPEACDACNVKMAYPTRRVTFDQRTTRCTTVPPCVIGCPPHDQDIPAFYRAECRNHRCIAWRYHGGG